MRDVLRCNRRCGLKVWEGSARSRLSLSLAEGAMRIGWTRLGFLVRFIHSVVCCRFVDTFTLYYLHVYINPFAIAPLERFELRNGSP